ncbi:MAG: nuclear transport factor 2 family protein [Candidatus Eremiobacteraeota bacterium]|nr:nuclear transport factor 2 family protein [Candidatus Eremiobacteraeota bacterium]
MSCVALEALLDAFTRHDVAAAEELFAPAAEYREAGRAAVRGREAIAQHFAAFAAHAAWRFAVDDVIRDGDRACVVYRFALSEGAGAPWRERAGCATVRLDAQGLIAAWREYEG